MEQGGGRSSAEGLVVVGGPALGKEGLRREVSQLLEREGRRGSPVSFSRHCGGEEGEGGGGEGRDREAAQQLRCAEEIGRGAVSHESATDLHGTCLKYSPTTGFMFCYKKNPFALPIL